MKDILGFLALAITLALGASIGFAYSSYEKQISELTLRLGFRDKREARVSIWHWKKGNRIMTNIHPGWGIDSLTVDCGGKIFKADPEPGSVTVVADCGIENGKVVK